MHVGTIEFDICHVIMILTLKKLLCLRNKFLDNLNYIRLNLIYINSSVEIK